jgi:hypothetical protein
MVCLILVIKGRIAVKPPSAEDIYSRAVACQPESLPETLSF